MSEAPDRRSEQRFSPRDIAAGVTVALILIPQSLAYATIAGVPPHVGLLASALPTIAAAPFASSRYLQTGPVATTALLTFGALSGLAAPFGAEYVALAALLAIIVGVVRLAIGLVGFGFVAYFMSRPVIIGFTVGATTLIAASQLPALLGVQAEGEGLITDALSALLSPSSWDAGAILFGLGAAVLIAGSRMISPRIPGVLIAVVIFTVVSSATGATTDVVGDIPTGLPSLSLSLPWGELPGLLLPGVVIALIGFTEAAAISTVFAAQDRERWSANREFISQGVANVASGISGGFPVGGSFARSSVDRLSGARTRWSGAVTGVVVLAFLPFAGMLADLPTSVLAAIVIMAVGRLIKPWEILPIWRKSRLQGLVALSTLAATLILSPRIDQAVLLGIGLAIVVHLGRELRLDLEVRVEDSVLTISPQGVVYFGSTPALVDALIDNLARHPEVDRLVIDLKGVGRIDFTGGNALTTIIEDSRAAGLDVAIVNTPPHARRIVQGLLGDVEEGDG